MSPLPSRDCVAICHPGQVRLRRTRAGIQKKTYYIEPLLDSGSRPQADSSGMTGSANCYIAPKGRGDFSEAKLVGARFLGKLVSHISDFASQIRLEIVSDLYCGFYSY